ncbi:MAG: hypothetical protein DMG14_32270 [Acidobacteria bacterium]|nr:MAG: hypothetical protein DMG14_32270 [Acidobacteriota bacterium]
MKICRYATLLALFGLSLGASTARVVTGQRAPAASDATLKAVAAAKAFLATLDGRQRAAVKLELNKNTRSKWSNLPNGAAGLGFLRNGIKLGDLSAAQQEAALALVASTLSGPGYQKVMNIVNADENLERSSAPARQTGNRVRFGRAEYQIAILGEPSATEPWMIQFGGHHLAINVTVVAAQNVLTPSHTGAQPSRYSLTGQTIRPLGKENDKGFALINALNAAQQKQAILNYRVADTVLGPGHDGEVIQPEGVRGSNLTANQQAMLLDLINEWVSILNDTAALAKMAEIKSSIADTYFAWSGPTTNGDAAYFRIQGPTVEIEYAPQGGSTDHIHTFYRDPTNDYGAKFIKP